MTRIRRIGLLSLPLVFAAAASPGGEDDAEVFAAAVEHLAAEARWPLHVDPRPLRPGADLRGLAADDLAGSATATLERAAVLARMGVPSTDAVADERCTFTAGAISEDRLRALPDSVQRRFEECRRRPPYASAAVGVPLPGAEPSAWRVDARVATRGGFRVWELDVRRAVDGRWRVVEARERSAVWS